MKLTYGSIRSNYPLFIHSHSSIKDTLKLMNLRLSVLSSTAENANEPGHTGESLRIYERINFLKAALKKFDRIIFLMEGEGTLSSDSSDTDEAEERRMSDPRHGTWLPGCLYNKIDGPLNLYDAELLAGTLQYFNAYIEQETDLDPVLRLDLSSSASAYFAKLPTLLDRHITSLFGDTSKEHPARSPSRERMHGLFDGSTVRSTRSRSAPPVAVCPTTGEQTGINPNSPRKQ